MDPEFWQQRWRDGRIGFHTEAPTPLLVEHWPTLRLAQGCRVFVPLAGKSRDLVDARYARRTWVGFKPD